MGKKYFGFYQVGAATVIKVVAEQLTKCLSAIIRKIENVFNILGHPTNAIRQDVINVNLMSIVINVNVKCQMPSSL